MENGEYLLFLSFDVLCGHFIDMFQVSGGRVTHLVVFRTGFALGSLLAGLSQVTVCVSDDQTRVSKAHLQK